MMEIFVTYSWINDQPDQNVIDLVNALRNSGYDAVFDVMLSLRETAINFNQMMAQNLTKANKVIVVLSEEYKKKADSFKGGVGDEYQYILEDIKTKLQKYIFVTFGSDRKSVVPEFLRGREILFLNCTDMVSNALLIKLNIEKMPDDIFTPVNPKKKQPDYRTIASSQSGNNSRLSNGSNLAATAMDYLKNKLYDKALNKFEEAVEENDKNPELLFYTAVCLLKGQKAFVSNRKMIDKIESCLTRAIDLEPKGVYYYFLAYIKYDYYSRKCINTSPDYQSVLKKASSKGVSKSDITQLFNILSVGNPF